MRSETFPSLVRDVDLLCLDAGNTVIFFDHQRVARLLTQAGYAVDAATLIRTEGEAKRAQEDQTLLDAAWPYRDAPGAKGWGAVVGTTIARAGVPEPKLPEVLAQLWHAHVELNLYSLVPAGLEESLAHLRATGARVAIVSNSEGMLDRLFEELGILDAFDAVVDSGKVGVEKPDPRIFQIAMDACHAAPERTIHLGDSMATDVLGARAAGIRHALIDPYRHWEGRHASVLRVPGAAEVADAIAENRR